jgi:hypothetical protein
VIYSDGQIPVRRSGTASTLAIKVSGVS